MPLAGGLADLVEIFLFFHKIGQNGRPEDGNPPGALVLTKLVEQSRFGLDGFLVCLAGSIHKGVHG